MLRLRSFHGWTLPLTLHQRMPACLYWHPILTVLLSGSRQPMATHNISLPCQDQQSKTYSPNQQSVHIKTSPPSYTSCATAARPA